MTARSTERLVYFAAVLVSAAAGVGALLASGELETFFLMVAAVTTGLLCFDTSMERRLQSRLPWFLIALAPVAKTIPVVWYELRADAGLLVERYDHVGSLLFGLCVLAAIVVLARPAPSAGSDSSAFEAVVVFATGLTAAVAGASAAFLFDRGFGTTRVARLIETPTWFVIGALLAGIAIAVSHIPDPPVPLVGLLVMSAASAAVLAIAVAGRDIDRGWWALVFAGFAVSAGGLGRAALGQPSNRTRNSSTAVVVAIIAGLLGAAAAIAARSDRFSWGPGWAILGVLSLALLGLALASRPSMPALDERLGEDAIGDIMMTEARASESALSTPEASMRGRSAGSQATIDMAEIQTQNQAKQQVLQSLRSSAERSAPRPAHSQAAASPPIVDEQPAQRYLQPGATQPMLQPAAPLTQPQPVEPQTRPASLSDASLVAAAQAAAELRDAPVDERHGLAPVGHAHHYDPSTGLLSAAGLQQALATAFSTPRRAGYVTLMMFTIRDLGDIERTHGRLASAAVTRQVAERIRTFLPAGTGARFARSAYAIVFVGDLGPSSETVQRLARVLLHLRGPVEGAAIGDKIDVVASMAQCYEGEDATEFVARANQGLARAVHTPEPTFVAMP